MKKKMSEHIESLIAKNGELYDDNVALAKEIDKDKAIIKELQEEIERLKDENRILSEKKCEEEQTVEIPDVENEVITDEADDISVGMKQQDKPLVNTGDVCANVSESIISASSVIGKIVLECAELCNVFTKEGGQNAKDLVNLALGRTEVFKSEILQLVTEYKDFNDAKAEVDTKVASIREYFVLLKKQL